jgi:ABC-type antimicrobial peptide transport system ATPase subunit
MDVVRVLSQTLPTELRRISCRRFALCCQPTWVALRKEDDIALLFVSHDLNVVRMLCDQIVVLRQGRVVEAGSSRSVFENPRDEYTRALLDAIPHFDFGRVAVAG